jgi:hypothetical protein
VGGDAAGYNISSDRPERDFTRTGTVTFRGSRKVSAGLCCIFRFFYCQLKNSEDKNIKIKIKEKESYCCIANLGAPLE